MSGKRLMGSTILGAVLSASLLLGAAIPASADQDDHCRHDVQRAERNLDKAVRKYGDTAAKRKIGAINWRRFGSVAICEATITTGANEK